MPLNSQSLSEAIALLKLRVAATAGGASADVAGMRDDEPMCMQIDRARLLAGREERVPLAGVDRRKAEVRRDLAEAHRVHAACGVASHFGRGQLGVPERDDRERDQLAARVAAPLLDHPVVVGADAGQTEVAVLGLGERLAAEAGNVGKQSDAST